MARGGARGRGSGSSRDQGGWWTNSDKVNICFVNPLIPAQFVTREMNEQVGGFFLQLGNKPGRCNEHCGDLCDDNDRCTVDDYGTCEDEGCPAFPRKAVDCGEGFTCDSSLGCIPIPSVPENEGNDPQGTISPTQSTSQPLESNTQSPSKTPTSCTENPWVFGVNVDIQVNFEGREVVVCSDDQWSQIQTAIVDTLNTRFNSVVPDWNGDVHFGPVTFDTTVERKLLRSRRQEERRLGVCSDPRSIPCETGPCYWGCLVAPTTSCGVNALTNWHNLGDEINESLTSLGYDCMGSASELAVYVLVDDPGDVL